MVAQTRRRSGWPAHRTLAGCVPRSVYYAWKRRESLHDRPGAPYRVYEVLPEERAAICEFALLQPKIGDSNDDYGANYLRAEAIIGKLMYHL